MEAEETPDERDTVTQTFPPSHILQDGRFIYLPEPTDAERTKFLERSIVRHSLLNADLNKGGKEEDGGDDDGKEAVTTNDKKEKEEKEDSTQPKLHPLAVASARLQANGVSELSKAINLSSLVSSGDYFSLSNIVNPVVDLGAAVAKDKPEPTPKATAEMQQDQKLRATYIGKRKRTQFVKAAQVLERHKRRVAAALTAQSVVDCRLQQLRPQWRLVAPEHGTRAKAHPVRPNEVVSIDVDVYDRDRTGGGNLALIGDSDDVSPAVTRGRLARRVPRFATVELLKDFNVKDDLARWKEIHSMDGDVAMKNGDGEEGERVEKTRAEPFAVADPTLGKIDLDFDPEKVPMLSLQLDIDKDSTGFRQSARLSPLTTLGENASEDEQVVVALQHSLFCASLFETIRKEIAPHEEDDNDDTKEQAVKGTSASRQYKNVWMSSDSRVNFLPPPSLMAGAEGLGGKGGLAVIHCHEGEVKAQLDSEYSMTVKLVEAGTATKGDTASTADTDAMEVDNSTNGETTTTTTTAATKESGSQNPKQLHVLCRALLLHAQDVYHKYSIDTRAMLKKKAKEKQAQPRGLERKRKKDEIPPARILQKCVCLGAKMLFEGKVRSTLKWIKQWLERQTPDTIEVKWIPLSLFDMQSQFTFKYRGLVLDVKIERETMTITSFGPEGEFRKVSFHSEEEFRIYLKFELSKQLKGLLMQPTFN